MDGYLQTSQCSQPALPSLSHADYRLFTSENSGALGWSDWLHSSQPVGGSSPWPHPVSLHFHLQAEGEGADGSAEEASLGGDWAPQKGDWAPTEGDRPPQGQNQKAETWWLKLGKPVIISLHKNLTILFVASVIITYWFIYCWSRQALYKTDMNTNITINLLNFQFIVLWITTTCLWLIKHKHSH